MNGKQISTVSLKAAIGFPSEEVRSEYVFRCGGTLISKTFVLTAAHCVAPEMPQPAIVRLGTVRLSSFQKKNIFFEFLFKFHTQVDLQKYQDTNNGFAQDIPIAQTIRHPEYRSSQLFNDIALLRLTRPADTSDIYVYPACINTRKNFPYPRSSVDVIGWGETEKG